MYGVVGTYLYAGAKRPPMSESETNAWGRTLESATEMADRLRADGWEVVTVRAAHVAPEPPAHGDTDRFGFVYLAQGEVAEDVRAAVTDGEFDGYELFTRREGSDLFALTRVTDEERDLAVLLVGAVDLTEAGELATAARDRGEMYSHVQLVDGTHLGSFRHEDAAPFFPDDV